MYILQSDTREHLGNSLVSFGTSVAAPLQASSPYFRLHSYISSGLVLASSFDASAPVLDGTAQFVPTDLSYSVRRIEKSKNSTHGNLSVRGTKNTVELFPDLLEPCVRAAHFCAAQQVSARQTLFCAHKFTQDSSSSSSSALTSSSTFMVSAVSLLSVDDPSHHRSNSARKSCAFAAAVVLALQMNKTRLSLALNEKIVS